MRSLPELLLLAQATSVLQAAPPPSGSRPNILVYFTDDQSKDSYGRSGGVQNDRAIDNLRIIAGAASDDEALSALLSGSSP